ncbi:DUF159-domain-containing protein [Lindgomyces ingoldianus]|uniref:DUF159-domain-containing protein n=1 Tax=Lindgomyces ingoldianus TaxID=673940 RepID=A0ACB6QQL1_9PLEO|nr:DUF159-domain-containing protein [Lindgomyces ingoldianus]KAF2468456.1 DUF159-domain-containing protein [Lindgomyces ingoldianus]
MCGRYALALRPSEVRRQLEQSHMAVDDAPDDDYTGLRQSYNFAPGYHGLVYRAGSPGFGRSKPTDETVRKEGMKADDEVAPAPAVPAEGHHNTKYNLQAMKWGLVPFWTKRNPDYASMMRTINCRDDSLYEDRGMWTSMKKKKRCIVVAQGFYEWLKKNNGKEKIPHFTRRKDGQLMCFAGLWDCVKFEGWSYSPACCNRASHLRCATFSLPRVAWPMLRLTLALPPDSDELLYTYAIVTTDSNKQLNFLHDRMPVILENGSEAIRTWLDPNRSEWSKDLQSLLQPYEGELECYPVSKEVGKVGNNSPAFVVPINSAENKNNIANFFGNQRKAVKAKETENAIGKVERDLEASKTKGVKIEHGVNDSRETKIRVEGTEENAPLSVPASLPPLAAEASKGIKRDRSEGGDDDDGDATAGVPQEKRMIPSSPAKGDGSRKITSFFSK